MSPGASSGIDDEAAFDALTVQPHNLRGVNHCDDLGETTQVLTRDIEYCPQSHGDCCLTLDGRNDVLGSSRFG